MLLSNSLFDNLRQFTDPPSPLQTGETRGAFMADGDYRGRDFSGEDLRGANFARADLRGAIFIDALLGDAILNGANIAEADFTGADLAGADLNHSHGERVGLSGAKLCGARLAFAELPQCSLVAADLTGADLRGAKLSGATLTDANLTGCDATGAGLEHAELCDATVGDATFDRADLRGALLCGVKRFRTSSWLGADVRDIPPLGVSRWKRFVNDQNYLEEFRRESALNATLYRVWWLTSDCGRSMLRWTLCTTLLVIVFAAAYATVPVDYGDYETWFSPFYYSVVTMTSLGYGDVLPASVAAQALAMTQVLVGYVMLGGLISILSNKMARRGE